MDAPARSSQRRDGGNRKPCRAGPMIRFLVSLLASLATVAILAMAALGIASAQTSEPRPPAAKQKPKPPATKPSAPQSIPPVLTVPPIPGMTAPHAREPDLAFGAFQR